MEVCVSGSMSHAEKNIGKSSQNSPISDLLEKYTMCIMFVYYIHC